MPKITEPFIQSPNNISSAVYHLWEKCRDDLTPEELEWYTGFGDYNDMYLSNLAAVLEGMGCLMANDTNEDGTFYTGAFQSADKASSLMYFVADAVRQARAMAMITEEAYFKQLEATKQ